MHIYTTSQSNMKWQFPISPQFKFQGFINKPCIAPSYVEWYCNNFEVWRKYHNWKYEKNYQQTWIGQRTDELTDGQKWKGTTRTIHSTSLSMLDKTYAGIFFILYTGNMKVSLWIHNCNVGVLLYVTPNCPFGPFDMLLFSVWHLKKSIHTYDVNTGTDKLYG